MELDISTAFDRVSHVGLLHKFKSYRISSQIFGLISSFLRNRRLQVIRHLICGSNLDWGKKWLVDFNAGNTQLVSFDCSNNNGSIDVKMDGSVLEEKHLLRC